MIIVTAIVAVGKSRIILCTCTVTMQTRSTSSKDSSGHGSQPSDEDVGIPSKDNPSAGIPSKKNAKWNNAEVEYLLQFFFDNPSEATANTMYKECTFNRAATGINNLGYMQGAPKTRNSCKGKWVAVCISLCAAVCSILTCILVEEEI
jgi:hypothetical protein